MSFYEQVRAAGTPRETRSEVIAFFKQEYPGTIRGKEAWKSKLVDALMPITGLKRESLNRRFETGRESGERISTKGKQEYADLGAMLPPIPPDGGYHIYGIVWVKFSDDACSERYVDEYVTGEEADKLAKQAADDLMQSLLNKYMTGDINEEDDAVSYHECDEPDLAVEPIEA